MRFGSGRGCVSSQLCAIPNRQTHPAPTQPNPHIPFSAARSPPNSNVNLITVQRRKRAKRARRASDLKGRRNSVSQKMSFKIVTVATDYARARRRSFFAGMSWVGQRVAEETARVATRDCAPNTLVPLPGGASATMGEPTKRTHALLSPIPASFLPNRSRIARSSSRLSRTYHQRME